MLLDKKGGVDFEPVVWLVIAAVTLLILMSIFGLMVKGVIPAGNSRICYWSVKARVEQPFFTKIVASEAIPTLCRTREIFVEDEDDVIEDLVNEIDLCVKMFEPALNPKVTVHDFKGDAIKDAKCFVCSVVRMTKLLPEIKSLFKSKKKVMKINIGKKS